MKYYGIEMDTEEWRAIPGANSYQVSNWGRIRSNKWGNWMILKTKPAPNGYPRVSLSCGAAGVRYAYVHRLVMEAFVGIDTGKPVVNHKDSNPRNSRLDNLEWCTQSHNIRHTFISGRGVTGDRHWACKVSDRQIAEILQSEDSAYKLAEKYGVTASYINRVRSGKLRGIAQHGRPVERHISSLMETEWMLTG